MGRSFLLSYSYFLLHNKPKNKSPRPLGFVKTKGPRSFFFPAFTRYTELSHFLLVTHNSKLRIDSVCGQAHSFYGLLVSMHCILFNSNIIIFLLDLQFPVLQKILAE